MSNTRIHYEHSDPKINLDHTDTSNENCEWIEHNQATETAALISENSTFFAMICKPQRVWHRLLLCRFTRKLSCRYLVLAQCFIGLLILIYLYQSSYLLKRSEARKVPPIPSFYCANTATFVPHKHVPRADSGSSKLREEPKVLLFTETQYSRLGKSIAELLVANHIKYKLEVIGKSLPLLTDLSKGKYEVIVFENYERYLAMDKWNRELLDKYLIEYGVGIIGFLPQHEVARVTAKLHNFPLYVTTNMHLQNISLNGLNPVLRLSRAGENFTVVPEDHLWTVFTPDHPTYIPIEWGYSATGQKLIINILDEGKQDGIKKVLFGRGINFWLHRLLLLDALSYLTSGRLETSLERYILIDIDDIFVGPTGIRMVPDDVEALLEGQKWLQTKISNFKFNLGFSGRYFMKGSYLENEGDKLILKVVDKFWWFGHMWGHTQPHKIGSVDQLVSMMQKNKEFAQHYGIPTDSGYSVAPHHSGIYPVHDPLYEAWKKVWNIRVTSSEEYPHLRPARLRRGFIHKNIMVLPRQTCGLFTHTNLLKDYPGGPAVLENSIRGGDLFQTIINNPINVFMTHQNNYSNDRLALYSFQSVVKFLECWTNIKLLSMPPLQLGEKYFHMFPSEVDPIWGNPCLDHRHMNIWSKNKTCQQLPKFLVIGPQKTGTTALYTFLAMHPAIIANNPSPETFEEIQFFNGRNYFKGIDWYMKFFPVPENSSSNFLFEKSATYFDGELVPRRVKALLPDVKLVTIIIPPEKRAYSWYHHMRAHNDPTSLAHSFLEVINSTSKATKTVRDLKNKCLNPGMYARNIERWLDYFPASSLSIIDGEQLRNDPVLVVNDLQRFLKIEPFYNYTQHLRFEKRKGFFCQVVEEDRTKCLGRGKGRQYPPMNSDEEKILTDFYKDHNIALEKLLARLNYKVPSWLYHELSG